MLLLNTIKNKTNKNFPIWIMRQAGRHLPEYQALKKQTGSLDAMFMDPKIATEVTLQPIRRYDMDAAVIFSDLLMIHRALGQSVSYDPLTVGKFDEKMLETDLKTFHSRLTHTYSVIKSVRAQLPKDKAVLGFVGAPYTILKYMLKIDKPQDVDAFTRNYYLQKLTDYIAEHANAQISMGADAIQIFDSWAGDCDEDHMIDCVFEPNLQLIEKIREKHPNTPIIAFPRMIGKQVKQFCHWCKPDVISLSPDVEPRWAAKHLKDFVMQGGLDPETLMMSKTEVIRRTLEYCKSMKKCSYIMNLGHGILPTTPIENVETMVATIKSQRKLGY
jgi:uroporphyrinogen decarboxylase